jgi:Fe-S cluster biosynthesis and repair protein YggX
MKCVACEAAGKPVKEFSSHWVKDSTGKVICPTLLSQNCRFCGKPGHTTKYCDALKKKKEADEAQKRPCLYCRQIGHNVSTCVKKQTWEANIEKDKKLEESKKKNRFAAAFESDSEDEEVQVQASKPAQKKKEEEPEQYPALMTTHFLPIEPVQPGKMSYATMLAMTTAPTRPKAALKTEPEPEPMSFKPLNMKKYDNWADASSSDEDEDD